MFGVTRVNAQSVEVKHAITEFLSAFDQTFDEMAANADVSRNLEKRDAEVFMPFLKAEFGLNEVLVPKTYAIPFAPSLAPFAKAFGLNDESLTRNALSDLVEYQAARPDLQKRALPSVASPANQIDLDAYYKNATGGQKVCLSLMKVFQKRHGGVFDPVEFFREYEHLTSPTGKERILKSASDFPVFLSRMAVVLTQL